MRTLATWLLMLCLSVWSGSAVYFSFFGATELFRGLPQDAAAAAVGLLFPTFFTLCAITATVSFLLYGWLLGRPQGWAAWTGWLAGLCGTLCALANRIVLLPLIQSVEHQMGPISKASGALLARFGLLHGISMLLDLVSIIAAVILWASLAAQVDLRTTARR